MRTTLILVKYLEQCLVRSRYSANLNYYYLPNNVLSIGKLVCGLRQCMVRGKMVLRWGSRGRFHGKEVSQLYLRRLLCPEQMGLFISTITLPSSSEKKISYGRNAFP